MTDSETDSRPVPDASEAGAHYGGSIRSTLAGDAQLEVMEVIREGWDCTQGIKGMVVAGVLLVYAAVGLVSLILGMIFGFENQPFYASTVSQLVIMMILYPFMAGVFMLGLKRSVGLPVEFSEQFSLYGMTLPILGVGVLQSVATSVGLVFLILPGLYLAIALSLAIPLKVEKNLPVVECLSTSLRLVNRKFLQVALLGLASTALMVVGILSLIGWIWTIPWTIMIFSITYRQLAGYDPAGAAEGPATVSY